VSTKAAQILTDEVALSLTPQISADNVVHMSISASVTGQAGASSSPAERSLSPIVVREADTVVRVRPGETVVMAGWLHDRFSVDSSRTKRPETTRHKTDLVILLTPTILQPRAVESPVSPAASKAR
jgi:type II secretory pathway component GspD/PulD (secretin)